MGRIFDKRPILDRILDRVTVSESSGCWEWGGARDRGCGLISVRPGKCRQVHRVMAEAIYGPIAPKLHVDHLCRNPGCANPDHLEVVTTQVNTMRGMGIPAMNARKDKCHNGHPFTAENTWVRVRKNGKRSRHCRACLRVINRANYHKAGEAHLVKRRARWAERSAERRRLLEQSNRDPV